MSKRVFILFITFAFFSASWFYLQEAGGDPAQSGNYLEKAKDYLAGLKAGIEKGSDKEKPPQKPTAPRPQPVSVLSLTPQSIHLSQSLPGRIVAFRQSQVRPQVDGVIIKRLFVEGAFVKKGQHLYQIDDARYEAALASAKADLRGAEANVAMLRAKAARYEKLVKMDVISQQQYDDIKAQYELAQANIGVIQAAIDTAQINLDYTKVYAPISGHISRSFVTEGALATANQEQPLALITQLDPVYVDIQLSGATALQMRSELQKLKTTSVRLWLNENPDSQYGPKGHLKFSEVTVNETAGSITLRAVFPNPDGILLPGLFVRTVLDLGQRKNVLLVPQRAAIRAPDGTLSVWVVGKDNTVEARPIQVSDAYKESWIIAGGVQAGETLVVEGYQKIGPGSQVVPSPWKATSPDKQGA